MGWKSWQKRVAIGLAVAGLSLPARAEQAVGLVLEAQGGELLRAGTALPLGVKAGDILFPGDSVRAAGGTVSFLFCPANSSQTLAQQGEVLLAAGELRVESGSLTNQQKVPVCILPSVERSIAASQQHYGGSLVRDLAPEQTAEGTTESRIEALPEGQRNALLPQLQRVDQAIAADLGNQAARVARAALFEQYKLSTDALQEYRLIAETWPEAAWVKSRLFVHDKQQATESLDQAREQETALSGEGKTYALLIGISLYQSPQIPPLQFAHEDAQLFEKHLRSPRGGSLPPENITLLVNEQATTAAIRLAFDSFLKAEAGPDDTVLVFFASHGTVDPETREGYIVTYDSDPQDLSSTGLPMADLQELVREELSTVKRAQIYVDVCHAGKVGAIESKKNRINSVIERLGEADGEILGMMASRPREVSYEGRQFGGGHGAFSYFLLNALNGAADYDQDGIVAVDDVIDYVREKVAEGTFNRQHPRDFGDFDNALPMANLGQTGIEMAPWEPPEPGASRQLLAQVGTLTRSFVPPAVPPRQRRKRDLSRDLQAFHDAVESGRVLQSDADNAFSALNTLRRQLPKQEYLAQANRLRAALEIQGQQVLLQYLKGEQAPQTRDDFVTGAAYFEAAQLLTPESLLLDARSAFCAGRIAIFDKNYTKAAGDLERAARLDSKGAYSYNALGIAYLEQANYERAILAFGEAMRHAPRWVYPAHNLALAYDQTGDYSNAIETYERAIELAPDFAYLPYNLGLLYQRLNRRQAAEKAYRQALAKAEKLEMGTRERYLAHANNALGYLKESAGRRDDAEKLYRAALTHRPDLPEARHNLAVLLADGSGPSRPDEIVEALDLLRTNLADDPSYLPSRISLARALARQGQTADAIAEYEQVVEAQPDFMAARLALAELHAKSGDPAKALAQLDAARTRQPRNTAVHEQIGDLQKGRGQTAEASEAYKSALEYAPDRKTKKRIKNKLKRM